MIAVLLKSTLAIAVALLLVAAAKRSRASLRHLVLGATFVFLLLLPLVQQFAPALELEVKQAPAIVVGGAAGSQPAGVSSHVAADPIETGGLRAGRSTTPVEWLGYVYAAGAALLLLHLLRGVFALQRLSTIGEVWLEGTARMNEIARDAGIRRAALVVLSNEVAVPLTFGFRRSTIVLPELAENWGDDELARALRHELEHVRREDWAFQILARAACALYWPQPLVWIAWRRFCLEAERACDDAVVRSGEPTTYAQQLVALARSMTRRQTLPALGMASPTRLSERVHAILDPRQPRGPHGQRASAAAFVAVAIALVSVGTVRLVAAQADDREERPAFATHGGGGGAADAIAGAVSIYREDIVAAARRGDAARVQSYLDRGIDVNTRFDGDGTMLIIAAKSGRRDMVGFLLDQGADPNAASPGDGNPLIAAAAAGHVDIVELLLRRGARIDEVVPRDENALITAARRGRADVARLLIANGANVNARVFVSEANDLPHWRTPLNQARRGGHTEIERMLLAAGAVE